MRFADLEYKHLAQMAEIEREAFARPWTVQMFIPELADPGAHYVVCLRHDEVIGYGGFHQVLDEAHVTNIAVKNTERGKGIGNLLMAELIARAKQAGAKHMTLEVREGNEVAIRLYTGFGFRVEGVRKRYYDNKYDALIMWLHFEE